MGFPSSGALESKFRNDARHVARFLRERHDGKFLVLNLSERAYDYALFQDRVVEQGFPDHHAPPLDVIWHACHTIDAWLRHDERAVVAVHCLAGKVRGSLCVEEGAPPAGLRVGAELAHRAAPTPAPHHNHRAAPASLLRATCFSPASSATPASLRGRSPAARSSSSGASAGRA